MTCRFASRQGSCHLAWKLAALKENSPSDQKLWKLKERIREQRRQCSFRALSEKRPTRGYVGELLSTPPLKRKVCKVAFTSPALRPGGPVTHRSQRGNESPMKRTKEGTGLGKTGARLSGASAWREGLRLARKILGPPLKYPKNVSEGEATKLSTGSKTAWLMTTQGEESLPGNCRDVQSKMEETEWTREVGELNPRGVNGRSLRLQKDPDLGKEGQKRPTRNAGPKCVSDGVKGRQSPMVKSASADALLEDSTRSSTNRKGRRTGSPQKSDHSGKENQPRSCDRPEMCRRNPYSPEQVHEFMKKKVAERNRRSQEEKRSLRQAREARNRRLQEVYRKQKEAFGRKKGRTESQRSQRGAAPATDAKRNQGLKCANGKHPEPEVAEWVHQASCALLRNEVKLHSDCYPVRNKMAEGTRRLDSPLSLATEGGLTGSLKLRDLFTPFCPTARYVQSPFLPLKRPTEAPAYSDTPGLSPYRNKQDRVRNIHILAQDLSERLEREMEKLQVMNGPADSSDQGWPSGTRDLSERFHRIPKSAVPQKEFGSASNSGALLDLSRLQRRSSRGQDRQERTRLEEGSATQAATERTQPLLSIARTSDEVWRFGSSPEGTAGWLDIKWRKETHEGGVENMEGFKRERNLLQGEPRAQPVTLSPPPQFCAGRLPLRPPTSPESEGYSGPLQKTGMDEDRSEKYQGLRPGQGCTALPQQWFQASGPSTAPSGNLPHHKTTAAGDLGDGSEAADSTSQWSEMSQFYGGSSTFCRLGLTMVEQHLREEELRSRHQSALLRLREKALQEKTKAELAWLEHEKRCQDSSHDAAGASATIEKQSALLTKLKQEQAEIQHLRNVGRAAHQERKLLLKQRKELLLVKQSTAQLWKQVWKRSGALPQQDARNPDGFEGAIVLGQERGEETFSQAPFGATGSGRSESGRSPKQGRNNNLCAESGERLSQGRMAAEEFPKRLGDQDAKSLEMVADKSHSSRERSVGLALKAGDGLASKGEKEHSGETSLIKSSKEDPHSFLDKGPESLASTLSFAKLYGVSPDLENPQLNPEFQKVHAILIDISGSSLSGSDLDADDAEATDVSLPEEFVFQEEPHDNPAGAVPCDTPVMSQRAISVGNASPSSGERRHIQASCGRSNWDNSSSMSNQKKTLEDTSGGDGTYEPDSVMLSNNGTPRLNTSWAGGSLSFQDHAATARRNATSLKSNGVNVMVSQGTPASEAALSSGSGAPHCPEDWRWQSVVPAISITEADDDLENTFDFKGKDEAMPFPPDTSLKNTDSTDDSFQSSAFGMNSNAPSFPLVALSSSEDQLVSDSRTCSAECLADEREPSRPDEAAAQFAKESTGYKEVGVGLLCPKTTEGSAQENQNSSPTNNQSPKEPGMLTLPSSSPQTGKLIQAKSCVMRCEDGTVLPQNEYLPKMEDDISSPVDEVLSYGSTDLPSSTEKDASFQYEDLPAPPEDLNGKSDDSNLSLQDFPPPPEPLVFPETEEPWMKMHP